MPATHTLQRRVFFLTSVLGVGLVVTMTVALFITQLSHSETHYQERGALLSHILGAQLQARGSTEPDREAVAVLEAPGYESLFDVACVYDSSGMLRASRHTGPPRACPPAPSRSARRGTLLASHAIEADGQPRGLLQLHTRYTSVYREVLDLALPMLLAMAGLIAVVVLSGRHLAGWLVAPINRLTEQARTFDPASPAVGGSFTVSGDGGTREVAELSRAFSRLIDNLVAARRRAEDQVRQRQAAEEAERESRSLLRHIVDLVPYLIFAIDRNGNVIFANRAVSELYDIPLDSLLSPGYLDRFRQQAPDGLLLAPFATDTGPDETWFTDRNGDARRFLVTRVPYLGNDSALVIGADVTQEHHLQLQLQFSQRLEVIGTLAGGIAHDFNNLLTPILGYTSMLMDADLPAPVKSKLEAVAAAAERARDVVHQILTFSRQHQHLPEKQLVALDEVVREATDLMRASIPPSVGIEVDCEPVAGVRADPAQIHQVIVNLCTNAAHAMKQRGGRISVKTLAAPAGSSLIPAHLGPGDYACIEVADDGCGISGDVVDHIFEPFFTTKEVGEGSGLGLSVVHGIVTGHGGDISVVSEEGRGTTFRVLLPLDEAFQSAATADSGGRGETVMLVDDEEPVLRMTTELLASQGFQVATFSDPQAALRSFRNDPGGFDVLITDHNMPQMTGGELASAVRAVRPDLPIIMITGFASAAARDLDAIDHKLMKPVSGRELALVIRSSLAERPAA